MREVAKQSGAKPAAGSPDDFYPGIERQNRQWAKGHKPLAPEQGVVVVNFQHFGSGVKTESDFFYHHQAALACREMRPTEFVYLASVVVALRETGRSLFHKSLDLESLRLVDSSEVTRSQRIVPQIKILNFDTMGVPHLRVCASTPFGIVHISEHLPSGAVVQVAGSISRETGRERVVPMAELVCPNQPLDGYYWKVMKCDDLITKVALPPRARITPHQADAFYHLIAHGRKVFPQFEQLVEVAAKEGVRGFKTALKSGMLRPL